MKKYIHIMSIIVILFVTVSAILAFAAITQISGLAVAQSNFKWNNVKDAAQGDNLTNGILANSLYLYDGTNFDRIRGDTTNGIDVDVTRVSGNVTVISNDTPTDSYTTPTDALSTYSLTGIYNGTTWDMLRSASKSTGSIVNAVDFIQNNVLLASGARTTSSNTGPLTGYGNYRSAIIQVNVTAASGTTPTLDVYIDTSIDDTNWLNIAHYTQFTTTGRRVFRLNEYQPGGAADADATADLGAGTQQQGSWGSTIRIRWVITGTSPSFTFDVTGTFKS
ncbi:MAG TPA: hypothetical protein ENG87_05905 [Candidatus Pacearchaeota archaeon]|nr:hypothetical protein [Candidatus Pacearchaeota archaeon]